jgi:hypothetical protein
MMRGMADGIAAILHLIVWAGFVAFAAVASPPTILAVTMFRRERPLWRLTWQRYRALLARVIAAI